MQNTIMNKHCVEICRQQTPGIPSSTAPSAGGILKQPFAQPPTGPGDYIYLGLLFLFFTNIMWT